MASFSVDERKSPAPKRREIELSKIISEALEPALFVDRYPRSTIDVYITVLNADGGTRCASITAAALALADAGIPMKGLVTSVASGKADGQVVLDLSDVEDKEGDGDIPLAIIPTTGEITLLQLDGTFSSVEFKEAISKSVEACQTIYDMQRAALLENYASIDSGEVIEDDLETEVSEEDKLDTEAEVEELSEEQEAADDYDFDEDTSD
jgi:exosome complex component RRP41